MSGADDQRGAEGGHDPVYRDTSRDELETELRQCRSDHRDLFLDVERRTAERDRLRARVAELEARVQDMKFVGDELADEVEARDTEYGPLARDVQAWRETAVSPDDAPTTAEPRADDGTDLRELRIDVCENCLARKPGTCHVPGCFYIRHTIDEVPTHLDAYAVSTTTRTTAWKAETP